MLPDDPRHGKSAGYIAGCRDQCCLRAKVAYDKRRRYELHTTGQYRKVPTFRATRRIQALQALGWSVPQIAKRTGTNHRHLYSLDRSPTIYVATLETISRAYNEMSMTLPPTDTTGQRISVTRARNHAARMGWPPPLAWDDIDNPNEHPKGIGAPKGRNPDDVDPVIVDRLLLGERISSTRAEKEEAMRRWIADGKSAVSLCRVHGWQEGRYTPREDVA